MSTLLSITLAAAATAYMWYKTIHGYRTGVLNLRAIRVDRQVAPRIYLLVLILVTLVSLVSLLAVALLIYGETHPEWRIQR
jgi:hypothetical protein